MKTIWKYEINITDEQTIMMPKGSRTLSFQLQNGIPCIWAVVEPNVEKEKRKFFIAGTGNPFPCEINAMFIGTIQNNGFVWHLFEQL